MRKSIKKIFAVGFFVAMFLCLTALFASAETWKYNNKDFEIQVEGDFKYILVSESELSELDKERGPGASIVGYTGTSASIAIPSTLGGKPVFRLSSTAFKGNTALQTVTIGESVKVIGDEAFMNCTGLQTALIAKNVDAIGTNAFNGCTALKSVTFQNGSVLREIQGGVFNTCTSLNNFVIPDGVETIGDWAFFNCDSMISIDIPDSVTALGKGAFFGCDSLREAVIGESVTVLDSDIQREYHDNNIGNSGTNSLADGVFEGCKSLLSVKIGSAVEVIGQDCFAGCGLLEIDIPDSVTTVGAGAFENCESMKTVFIGNGVSSIGSYAFASNNALESAEINGVNVVISACAFENNPLLSDVKIGNGVISLGDFVFNNCDSLKTIIIPSSVTSVGGGILFGCDNLERAVIGNGVTDLVTATQREYHDNNIGNWGSNSLADGAFEGCVNLKTVTIGSAVKTIGQDCFAGTALEKVDIPDNVIKIEESAFRACDHLEKVVIGRGVTSIGDSAFRHDDMLTDVSIGSGVVSINAWAFMDCVALPSIKIPSNVTSLGAGCFWNCTNLKNAVIGNGVTELLSAVQREYHDNNIGNWGTSSLVDGTFEGCINLKEVTLGSGIIAIGRETFAGTQITTLTIPGKVSTLSEGAFENAKQLKDIYFTGNWAASVGGRIFENIAEGYTVHYVDGKIGYDELTYNMATFSPVTVKFDNNNADVFAAPTEDQILAPVGGYVIEPISPTAFGYLFAGWYKDKACTQPWNFTVDKVNSDTTIYAKWNSVDEVAPVRPENIATTEKDGDSVTLQWSEVDGATGYNVYVDGAKINDSTIFTTSYTVEGLESATTYEFVVTAVNSKGESEHSLIFADRTTDHVHEYGEWTVVTEANCGSDGEQTRTCECGTVESEVIPSTGVHSFGDWYVTLEPSCVDAGEQAKSCSVCGEKETDSLPATGEHAYGDWTVVKEATEDEEGLREHTCETCGETESQTIPSLSSAVKGDVNGDGKVTAADARIVLRAAAQIEILSDDLKPLAEVTGDDKITAADARLILRAAAQIEKI